MTGRSAGGAAHWLSRLLNLVPYLLARPGIRVAAAAADLGVSEQQLRDDLALLWVCGLPGYGPGDLIDMAFDGDRVTITYDAGIDRPLRLTADEALALVVALRTLAETPGVADRDAIDRALGKLEQAVGGQRPPVAVRMPDDGARLARVREAVTSRRALEITYYSATSDQISTRVVDPLRVVVVDGHGYLEAWCRRAGDVRRFRVDRIDAVRVRDEPAAPPPAAQPRPIRDRIFQPGDDAPLVTLRIGRGARWIAEYYPCERVDDTGEQWLVSLRVRDLAWARRLVLRLGSEAVVIAPVELADAVQAQAQAALATYATPAGMTAPWPPAG